MELISEQKIIDSINSNRTVTTEIEAYTEGFTSGVSFSENELKNLAIDFAEFLRLYYYVDYSNFYEYDKNGEKTYYTNEELFKKFIEQRNKS